MSEIPKNTWLWVLVGKREILAIWDGEKWRSVLTGYVVRGVKGWRFGK